MTQTFPSMSSISASDRSWVLASRVARPELAPYVRDYQGYEEFLASGIRRRELPHGGVVLVINFGADWLVADPRLRQAAGRHGSFVAGVDDFASLVNCDGRGFCLQVNFTPIGARRFLGVPMHELARRVVAFDDLAGRNAERLTDRLFQAKEWSDRFDIVEGAIQSRLAHTTAEDAGVRWAWQTIESQGGRGSIGRLAQVLDCSRKHLTARFHDQIGLPPKTVAGIVRFNRALKLIGASARPDLARIAAAAGYFDQSHFNRDFVSLSGITPGEFLRARLIDGDGLRA